MYLWNPSIRKFKMLAATGNIANFYTQVAVGFAYHSQNNDFKVLRIVCNEPAEAELYTLSTDSWRRFVISVESSTGSGLNGSITGIDDSPCVFLNGALHSIACSALRHHFILSFDLNDEKFREVMLPWNYFHGLYRHLLGFSRYLAVSQGLLTFIVFGKSPAVASSFKCLIWVMREYGVSMSWTSKIVNLGWVDSFYGCTDNGEFLIENSNGHLFSFDHESLEENSLGIQFPAWVVFASNLMESLVLLEQKD
ncbi:F-box/kelch-repeat protein At3g23880-like [Quercus suber]|uniref:F-box/kelch-repeat protein At3g23880-like n=1 Tax=Quercus suber TaxID=58331 RepID=UPI0032DE6CC0